MSAVMLPDRQVRAHVCMSHVNCHSFDCVLAFEGKVEINVLNTVFSGLANHKYTSLIIVQLIYWLLQAEFPNNLLH